jgi:hypothetical protein
MDPEEIVMMILADDYRDIYNDLVKRFTPEEGSRLSKEELIDAMVKASR